jgi:hypothetical protein
MGHKIVAGILLALSSIFLGLSLAGMIMAWTYNEQITQAGISRMQGVDSELAQVQTALQTAKAELERTQRIVETTETAMTGLKNQLTEAKAMFGFVNGTLDQQLIPGLKASREKINQAKSALQSLRATLDQINSLPFLSLNLPGDTALLDLINGTDSIDAQIAQAETLVQKASTFMSDSAYFLGADFTETKQGIQNFLTVINAYDQKISAWRAQMAMLIGALPGWVDGTSIGLTIFLLWFGFSQFGLLLHGLTMWRGADPLAVLRQSQAESDYEV